MSSIDVIIPCYKYGHFLEECVRSVLSQDGPSVRVLIIDDASPDDTAVVAFRLAKEDARVTFRRHSSNQGHIATYNEGIQWASAKYMLLLSADDYLLPGALGRTTRLMDDNREVGFTFGDRIQLNDAGLATQADCFPGTGNKACISIFTGREFIEASRATNIVSTPTAVVRTELQKRVGGYRPQLPHSGDMEMWFRLAAHGFVGFVRAYQAVYRIHSSNMSSAYVRERLPDVQQRKLALDYFFQDNGPRLLNVDGLRSTIYRCLACDAVAFASSAFEHRDLKASEQLMKLALAVCPDIKRSWPWTKFACKRVIGMPAWSALKSFAAYTRLGAT